MKKKGFSLVEILVSISIIIILSTIGVQTFYTAQSRSRLEEDISKVLQALRKAQNSALAPSRSETGVISSTDKLCSIGVKVDKTNKTIQPIYQLQISPTFCSSEYEYGIYTQLKYASIDADKVITFGIPFATSSNSSLELSFGGVTKTIIVTDTGLIKVE